MRAPTSPPLSKSWRRSTYARAAVFVILGGGAVLGAAMLLSRMMVDETVTQLLSDRTALARATGGFIEDRLRTDLSRLAPIALPVLQAVAAGEDPPSRSRALARSYALTLYQDGVLLLDSEARPVLGVPDMPPELLAAVDLPKLVAALDDDSRTLVTTELLEVERRRLVLVVAPVARRDGTRVGYLGGLLQPATTDILGPTRHSGSSNGIRMDLVDRLGMVIASTDPARVFRNDDHDSVIASAIADRVTLKGRCHRCHDTSLPMGSRGTNVMTFVPLPTLAMGLMVQQPEEYALASAMALQRQALWLGGAFAALFVIFAALSVRSVVRPIKHLTADVREAESGSEQGLNVSVHGQDEVGELARALETWRSRLLESMAALERHRDKLRKEGDATREHADALDAVAAASIAGVDVDALLRLTLKRIGGLLGIERGALRVRHKGHDFVACIGWSGEEAESILDGCEADAHGDPQHPHGPGAHHSLVVSLDERVVAVCTHDPTDARILAALRSDTADLGRDPRLVSLLQATLVAAGHRFAHAETAERGWLKQQYLHRVLGAQEDERRRVARGLHDTLLQDLSALRLEVERQAGHTGLEASREALSSIEGRVREMIGEVRRVVMNLRLTVLESAGLLPALQQSLDQLEPESGIRGTLAIDGQEPDIDYRTAVTVYRIFQEAVQNAVLHGKAEQVFVTVTFRPGTLELLVEDDGRGFDVDVVRSSPDGSRLGLLGMEERAQLIGASVSVASTVGEGTTVQAIVPLAPPPVADA